MATNTTNYNLVKPAYADTADIADINSNMDVIDGQMKTNADGVSANATSLAKSQGGLAYIVGNTNTTGITLAVGTYVYVKGHSSITEGLREVTASISNNGSITTSNTSAVSNGGFNSLNSKIASVKNWRIVAEATSVANTPFDQTVSLSNVPSTINDLLFTVQRVSNGRTFATAIVSYGQYVGGAVYAFGSFATNASSPINVVAIYTNNGNSVEFATDWTGEAIKCRLFMR